MHLKSILGKVTQLRRAPPSLWGGFVAGWIFRRKRNCVPCVIPGAGKLLRVPLNEFYESYQFFCEAPLGNQELDFFLGKLKPSDIFYDIGGFRGAYSAAAKLKLQDAVSIHVFEPLGRNADAIQTVATHNAFAGFKLNRLAVGDGSAISGSVNEQDAMLRLGDKQATAGAEFPSVSIDEYIAFGNPPPSMIKIDVDGFELHVLRGAQKTFRKHRPRLWLEIHPTFLEAQGQSAEKVVNLLRETGYTLSNFDDFNSPDAIRSYHVWCE